MARIVWQDDSKSIPFCHFPFCYLDDDIIMIYFVIIRQILSDYEYGDALIFEILYDLFLHYRHYFLTCKVTMISLWLLSKSSLNPTSLLMRLNSSSKEPSSLNVLTNLLFGRTDTSLGWWYSLIGSSSFIMIFKQSPLQIKTMILYLNIFLILTCINRSLQFVSVWSWLWTNYLILKIQKWFKPLWIHTLWCWTKTPCQWWKSYQLFL